MKPSLPEVVSGVSRSVGSAATICAATRRALTSLPVANPGWTPTPLTRSRTSIALKDSSQSSPRLDASMV